MGAAPPRACTESERIATYRFPCDGVPRFKVSGQKRLTYSAAWEGIFLLTGGRRTGEDRSGYEFTPMGVRRIARLNALYLLYPGVKLLCAQAVLLENAALEKATKAMADVTPAPTVQKPVEP